MLHFFNFVILRQSENYFIEVKNRYFLNDFIMILFLNNVFFLTYIPNIYYWQHRDFGVHFKFYQKKNKNKNVKKNLEINLYNSEEKD